MAYEVGDWLFTIEGTIGPYETWSNTWAAKDVDSLSTANIVADKLIDFYTALTAWTADEWSATTAQGRDLFLGASHELTWSTVTGANTQDLLPTQLAIRASLDNAFNNRGGPFLCGWAKQASSANGLILDDIRTDIIEAIQTLAASVVIGLHRPTHTDVVGVHRVRVGQRFDVIRRRGNDVPEAYSSGTF